MTTQQQPQAEWWVNEFNPQQQEQEDPWEADPWAEPGASKPADGERKMPPAHPKLSINTKMGRGGVNGEVGSPMDEFDPFFNLAVERMEAVASPPASPMARDMMASPRAALDNRNPFADSDSEADDAVSDASSDESESDSGSDSSDSSDSEEEEAAPAPRKKAAAAAKKKKASSSKKPAGESRGEIARKKARDSAAKAQAKAKEAAKAAAASKAKATKKSQAATKYPEKYLDVSVDATAWMKQGAAFLKYGKSGYPHFRWFRLTTNNTAVQFYSPTKRGYETTVYLKQINEIVLGQHTPVFQRFPSPALKNLSFSILYAHRTKSLDLIANDPNDYLIFVKGVQALLSIMRKDSIDKVSRIKKMTLRLPMRRAKRTSAWILRAAGIMPEDKLDDQLAPWIAKEKNLARAGTRHGKKSMPVDVQRTYAKTSKKLRKVRLKVQSERFLTHPLYDTMLTALQRCEDSLRVGQMWMKGMHLEAADDEIWRADVDLDAIEAMANALKNF